MIISATAVLIAFGIILVLGLVNIFTPFFRDRRRGKKTLDGVDGIQPHWLVGNMKEV